MTEGKFIDCELCGLTCPAKDHIWFTRKLSRLREELKMVREKALEEAAKLCERKYPCSDPSHDDGYCHRCRAIEDGMDMLLEEILKLKELPRGE